MDKKNIALTYRDEPDKTVLSWLNSFLKKDMKCMVSSGAAVRSTLGV